MQLNQINNLRKEMNAVETTGQANNYRRRRVSDPNNKNYKNEYARITGGCLSQTSLFRIDID